MNKSVHFKTDQFVHASIKTETEGSLFHYTSSLNVLETIVNTGFLYSYCFEEHSERVAKGEDWSSLDNMKPLGAPQPQYGIATPMISFCDIPLLKASEHRAKFGNYCIGVNKELMRKELPSLNPLLYCTSDWIYDAIEKLVEYLPTKNEKEKYIKAVAEVTIGGDNTVEKAGLLAKAKREGRITNDIKYESAFESAVNILATLVKRYEGFDARYYNEHEWRVFFTEAGGPIHSFTREQFDEQKGELNKKLWADKEKAYLTFGNQEKIINYIIVSKEDEIPELIKRIRGLKVLLGRPIPDNDEGSFIKDIIISKITSFERIEADY